ncbi:Polygalacturonase 1 beta-like protein 3 [Stylosanthes scabra]|uniref:Polygalacturonase 1 beta-like protein 3 n=1 Tax=Stylosanthes scabra TaxID=79078 RepID=A0ABU6SLY0_9FABA|nr:Polygalacturonase 1 beta-like protein 3 [Stylosanthes scabra]
MIVIPASGLVFIVLMGKCSHCKNCANPFTPKASLLRYWENKIHNNLLKSNFLISKASPLTTMDAATFSKLAGYGGGIALSTRLPKFCAAANLLCFPELGFPPTRLHQLQNELTRRC